MLVRDTVIHNVLQDVGNENFLDKVLTYVNQPSYTMPVIANNNNNPTTYNGDLVGNNYSNNNNFNNNNFNQRRYLMMRNLQGIWATRIFN